MARREVTQAAVRQARVHMRRRRLGLCYRCGKREPMPDRKACFPCLRADARRKREG